MMKKIILSFVVLIIISCDNTVSSTSPENANDRLYVALQGMGNKVAILDAVDLELIEMINIDFSNGSTMMEMPHYIAIDDGLNYNPSQGYWFVTTMGSSSVGMFSLESNELIDVVSLESPPALFEIDPASNTLYVSRMPNVDLLGSGMAMGSASSIIDKITYSSEGMLLDNTGYDTNHPSPHAISINEEYSKIITASLTEDFIARINLVSGDIVSTSLDPSVNPAPIPNINRLKPLEIVQANGFAFITCMGGEWGENNENIRGQVQVWDVENLVKVSEYEFGSNSNPWHIAHDAQENAVYVALSGYTDGSEGESAIIKLDYDVDGHLVLVWENRSSDLKLLHGIDLSPYGGSNDLYVSSRDGSIYKLNKTTGAIESTQNLTTDEMPYPAPGGIKFVHIP
tara:strand:+ start:3460 stop:4656 length:1197 start_codon:yes stop_codon:yes gene_type:complete